MSLLQLWSSRNWHENNHYKHRTVLWTLSVETRQLRHHCVNLYWEFLCRRSLSHRPDNFVKSITGFASHVLSHIMWLQLWSWVIPGDNEWHTVHIGRYESFITLEIDGSQTSAQLVNPTPVRYNKDIFIGGSRHIHTLQSVRTVLN